MSKPTKMEVNAAIERLIARNDDQGEAARIVILYGDQLKKSALINFESTTRKSSDSESVSGYTPELGHVEVHDGDNEETTYTSFGVYKDRVGHYRLWKRNKGMLLFHHFWKSDDTTMRSDEVPPDEYCLFYNQETLEPEGFCLRTEELIFRIGSVFILSRVLFKPIYGRSKNPWQFQITVR